MVRGLLCLFVIFVAESADAQDFTFICPEVEIQVDSAVDSIEFTVLPKIWANGAPGALTAGYAMGVAHDPTAIDVIDVENLLPFSPAFFSENLLTNGWSVGVVFDFLGSVSVSFPTPFDIVEVTYQTEVGYLDGSVQTTELNFSNSLGSPPVTNVVVVSGASAPVALDDGSITFRSGSFVRGDVNSDGAVDISDAVSALASLFLPGTDAPGCLAAADINDDAGFDISDPVYLLGSLFVFDAPDVPEPSTCGIDPTQDLLSCFEGCL